jgi:hypothetical protein
LRKQGLQEKESSEKTFLSAVNGKMACFTAFSEKNGKNPEYWKRQLHEF